MNFSKEELQAAASRAGFGNANGDNYSGLGDRAIDFGNGASFLDENSGEITITLASTAASNTKIAICPGYFANAADIKDENGVAVGAILADGVIVAGVSCACSPKSAKDMLGFLFSNPGRIVGVKVAVDDVSQLDHPLYYRNLSPFKNMGDDRRIPASYKSENQQNEKIATIKDLASAGWIFGANSVLLYELAANRKATITLYFGAIASAQKQLEVSAKDGRAFLAQAAVLGRK